MRLHALKEADPPAHAHILIAIESTDRWSFINSPIHPMKNESIKPYIDWESVQAPLKHSDIATSIKIQLIDFDI